MCNVQRILVVWEYVCVGFLYTTILLTLNIYYIGVCILAFYLFLQIECCMIVFLKIKKYYKFIVKKNNFKEFLKKWYLGPNYNVFTCPKWVALLHKKIFFRTKSLLFFWNYLKILLLLVQFYFWEFLLHKVVAQNFV